MASNENPPTASTDAKTSTTISEPPAAPPPPFVLTKPQKELVENILDLHTRMSDHMHQRRVINEALIDFDDQVEAVENLKTHRAELNYVVLQCDNDRRRLMKDLDREVGRLKLLAEQGGAVEHPAKEQLREIQDRVSGVTFGHAEGG
ncbi:hypothetical protein J1614_001221 [Plenodomus biglobosus]|nr:hypothetical protein J1614_001221 [Plenodomus biglobosus]